MLYLDYGKNKKNWRPNIFGDNRNLEAIEFIKHLNSIVRKETPSIFDSGRVYCLGRITKDVENDGLGFFLNGIWGG
jgi:1,4-alpha-glucan branching enzyme